MGVSRWFWASGVKKANFSLLRLVSPSDVLALPIFKQEKTSLPSENETKNPPFQYVLCAATSPAVKLHDETLTYLNQGETPERGAQIQVNVVVWCGRCVRFHTPLRALSAVAPLCPQASLTRCACWTTGSPKSYQS